MIRTRPFHDLKSPGSLLRSSLLGGLLALPAGAAFVAERSVASPDGELVLRLERDDASDRLVWSVGRTGRPVVTRGTLGIELGGIGTLKNPVVQGD